MKEIYWMGTSLDDLKGFPEEARRDAGFSLSKVQSGQDPVHYKPMPSIGAGVTEIKIKDEGNEYRVMYVANRPSAIYVLHSFQKKTQRTSKKDIDLTKARLKEVPNE